jgi:ABC-type bacteriocin/lantibiotic exporter with double-glycine peptidase domain
MQRDHAIAALKGSRDKMRAELPIALVAGFVAVVCLIIGVVVVKNKNTTGGMLIAIAAMTAFVIRIWYRFRVEQAKLWGAVLAGRR